MPTAGMPTPPLRSKHVAVPVTDVVAYPISIRSAGRSIGLIWSVADTGPITASRPIPYSRSIAGAGAISAWEVPYSRPVSNTGPITATGSVAHTRYITTSRTISHTRAISCIHSPGECNRTLSGSRSARKRNGSALAARFASLQEPSRSFSAQGSGCRACGYAACV